MTCVGGWIEMSQSGFFPRFQARLFGDEQIDHRRIRQDE